MGSRIVALLALLSPALAAAQPVCPYGLVAVDAAHCCWPGQAFSTDRQVCTGVPQCPAGLSPVGETCLASQTAPQQPAPPAGALLPPPPPAAAPGAPQAPLGAVGSAVRFETKRPGNEFTVTIDDQDTCNTPCDLNVTPGKHRVKIAGDASYEQDLNFPAGPARVELEKRRPGLLALGIVSLAVGVPAAVGGAFACLVGIIQTGFSNGNGKDTLVAGAGVMFGGIILAAVGGGVGLGMAGRNRARLAKDSYSEADAPPVTFAGVQVAPTPTGAMVGATFAF